MGLCRVTGGYRPNIHVWELIPKGVLQLQQHHLDAVPSGLERFLFPDNIDLPADDLHPEGSTAGCAICVLHLTGIHIMRSTMRLRLQDGSIA